MSELLIRNARLILEKEIRAGNLWIKGHRLTKVILSGSNRVVATRVEELDCAGMFVAPGFIDLHVHGGGGADFMTASPQAFETVFSFHVRHGTTALLATLLPAPLDVIKQALCAAAEHRAPYLLGVYLEGPFISKAKKGAFDPQWITAPTLTALETLFKDDASMVRIVTFAPEISSVQKLLKRVLALGAIPAIGHTNATYEQAKAAVRLGARHFTHLGNAMRGFHHREPGVVGAALDSDAYVELICDGVHLHPAFVRLVVRVKGYDSICLVTDAISAAGLPDGQYSLGGLPVLVRDGVARLSDGTLAGSTLTLDRAVKNFLEFTGCSLPEAVRCATLNPARLLGIDGRKGSLEVGKDADLVIFDENFTVHYTILGGKIVYART